MTELKRVRAGEFDLAYRQSAGRGRAVVLVHGNSSQSRVFEQLLASPLGERHRLLALDLPGHGASARLPADREYGVALLAAAVRAFAEAVGAEGAVFVGHSLGGHLLLETELPAAAIAIFGTAPLGRPADPASAWLPCAAMPAAFKAEVDAEEIDALGRAMFAGEPPRTFADDLRATDPRVRAGLGQALATGAHRDERAAVAGLKVPLAMLHAEREALVNGAYLAALPAPTLWRGAVQIIAGAGHYAQLEAPRAVHDLLASFITDTGAA